jgi:hypothetical protein
MTEISDKELIEKLQSEQRKLLELLNHLSAEVERRAQEDRTPVFLDLGHLLIRPEAIQYIERIGSLTKINRVLDVETRPADVLALLGARIVELPVIPASQNGKDT